MFPGSAFGVDVTVAELCPVVPGPPRPVAGERPMRLDEMLPAESMTDAELAREIQRATQVEAVIAAYKTERIVQLAARRTSALDRRRGDPGAAAEPHALIDAGISEFFPDELAQIMNCSRTATTVLTEHAVALLTDLTATWEKLAAGELDWPRARALAAELGAAARVLDPAVITAVEAAVLPEAPGLSVRALRAAVRRELIVRDPASADRRRLQAERASDVELRHAPDGMSELGVFCPHPLAVAIRTTVDTYARMAKEAGDGRPLGQLRVAMLADLVLRPWDDSRPPVTTVLQVIAPVAALRPSVTAAGDTRPAAEVDGEPITAAAVRELLEDFDALCPGGLQSPTGGRLDIAIVDSASGALRATATRAELERLARHGCPSHPDNSCECPVLGRPPAVDRYRPTPAQRRFGTTRDRTCRHPGCRNRAVWADLDHVLAHAAGGITDCTNLCCLCRRHHRLKTHAPGWSFVMAADGVLTVTTPSGVTRVTRPPGLRDGPGRPPPAADPPPF
jgi:hypothetical protein